MTGWTWFGLAVVAGAGALAVAAIYSASSGTGPTENTPPPGVANTGGIVAAAKADVTQVFSAVQGIPSRIAGFVPSKWAGGGN